MIVAERQTSRELAPWLYPDARLEVQPTNGHQPPWVPSRSIAPWLYPQDRLHETGPLEGLPSFIRVECNGDFGRCGSCDKFVHREEWDAHIEECYLDGTWDDDYPAEDDEDDDRPDFDVAEKPGEVYVCEDCPEVMADVDSVRAHLLEHTA